MFFACALFAFVMALLPKPPAVPLDPGDKFQHMMAFFTLGVLSAAGWRKSTLLAVFVPLALFGGAIELFQLIPALHRDGDWVDWLADMAAAAVGIGLTRLALDRLR